MTLTEFLTLLVPPGVLVAGKLVPKLDADGNPYNAFSHSTAKQYADFATHLVRMDGEHLNTYFALASYKQGFHTSPTTGKKQLRVRTNVDQLKALWFDIDFKTKKDGTPPLYPDAKTAALALKLFAQATKIPTPSVLVNSGNGMHCYWPFDQPVPLERWQTLADALKAAAIEHKLDIDPTCTADACRVLRPIGTSNWKDPANPKPVQILHTSGKLNTADDLESVLTPWIGKSRVYRTLPITIDTSAYAELTGGLVPRETAPSRFDILIKHCGVARMLADSHGKDAPEPLWTASLQLLKHCEDGPLWVHPISDGHPGYNADATERKWEHRQQNSAGPTLCSTFESHEPTICNKCPHRGFVKTPLQLGYASVQAVDGLPLGWRIAPDRSGIERLMIDPTNNSRSWVRMLRYVIENLRATRSVVTHNVDYSFVYTIGNSVATTVEIPSSMLGNRHKLLEELARVGCVLKEQEVKAFHELMTTWHERLQAARRVAEVTEQLGWVTEPTPTGEKLAGFSYGPATFYADGRVRDDVRTAREFAAIAKHFEPKGDLDKWKHVADFLATQNKPAFTAILAAGFGAPLLRFTGHSGGILSIVSTASGVGKSSALKCSQAIWGSPMHGMNSVDDTPKSVARKLGFLNNLPAYWDELRGRKTVDDFLTLAFQVTQGKERTRLDSSAQLREVSTWETMLVVASNESIFEAMGRHGGGSDAGIVRTFEIIVEPFVSGRNPAELALLFETLNGNYGQAGKVYAQYLATHAAEVEQRVRAMFTRLATSATMEAQERFWFAIVAATMVGAQLAGELGLVKIDLRDLLQFLLNTVNRLRSRAVDTLTTSQPLEVLSNFIGDHQDKLLSVDHFPRTRANTTHYMPDLSCGMPRSDNISIHVSRAEQLLRVPRIELERWLLKHALPLHSTFKLFKNELGARELRVSIGLGTKWKRPPQQCLEFNLAKIGMNADDLKAGDAATGPDAVV